MNKLIASIALAATAFAANAANAGTTGTCLSVSAPSNYGMLSPSSLRQCFGRLGQSDVDQALGSAGYVRISDHTYSSVYRSDSGWILTVKNSARTYVSEIIIILDKGL